MTGSFIVKARVDSRGGARVFGLTPDKTKSFIGETFNIGGKDIKVTTDGRINIPKKIMNQYGIIGDDGRKRITLTYSSKTNREFKRSYAGFINKPLARDKNRPNNWRTTKPRKKTNRALKPKDSPDYSWSPI